VLSGHVPDEPEALACHALLLLHEARAAARVDAHGDLVSLEDQDRGLWDDRMVARGDELLQRSLRLGRRRRGDAAAAANAFERAASLATNAAVRRWLTAQRRLCLRGTTNEVR
jgi:RNA polymerase sigma-70 factor (ECF subfamily)